MKLLDILLEITVYSVIVYGVLLLFRTVLKNRLSPVLRYSLWFLLIARLLMPVTIDSGLSLVTIPAVIAEQKTDTVLSEPAEVAENGDAVMEFETALPKTDSSGTAVVLPKEEAQTVNAMEKFGTMICWQSSVLIIWLTGAVFLLLCTVLSSLCFKRKIRSEGQPLPDGWQRMTRDIGKELRLQHPVSAVVMADFPSPAVNASLRPVMVLPRALLFGDEEQVRFAMIHEMTQNKYQAR